MSVNKKNAYAYLLNIGAGAATSLTIFFCTGMGGIVGRTVSGTAGGEIGVYCGMAIGCMASGQTLRAIWPDKTPFKWVVFSLALAATTLVTVPLVESLTKGERPSRPLPTKTRVTIAYAPKTPTASRLTLLQPLTSLAA